MYSYSQAYGNWMYIKYFIFKKQICASKNNPNFLWVKSIFSQQRNKVVYRWQRWFINKADSMNNYVNVNAAY